LTVRALGIWFSDAIVWPLVLIAAGGALIWRQSMGDEPAPVEEPPAPPQDVVVEEGRRAAIAVSRTGLGIVLVIAAGFVFLQTTGALGAARDVLLAVIAAVVVLGVIFAPWIVRLLRSLTEERAERIRSQERAEVAAHLHDSVLQTLAMMQRRAGEPGEVAALARRQERELRAWLAGRPAPGQSSRLAGALEAAAAEVEESHGVPVEVVVVGDRELDAAHEAVVAAAREAMTNAAKFGRGSPVDVYAESEGSRTQVFIRDRGPGFDTGSIPPDRRGVRESIRGRMERHGGRARITSSPGTGTEVELVLEDET
jgi:signal transduction histidine kinase